MFKLFDEKEDIDFDILFQFNYYKDEEFKFDEPLPLIKIGGNSKNILKDKKYKNSDIRKAKRIIIIILLKYANNLISKEYNGNIGSGILKKKLKKINPFSSQNISIDYNIKLLNKTLAEIFSQDLGKKFSCSKKHNKILIDKLLNEEDEKKRQKFRDFFNMTLNQSISLLSIPNDELKMYYDNEFQNLITNEKDAENLKDIINNLNNIFSKKKPRKKKTFKEIKSS